MIKKETVLYYANSSEDEILLSKLYDNYTRTVNKYYSTYSDFLSYEQILNVSEAFSADDEVYINFFGGYEDAERKIVCFSSEEKQEDYPLSCIKLEGNNLKKLGHRDVLGALMGLGIKRETVGDIITGEEIYIFSKKEMADYIVYNIESVGRSKVEASVCLNPLFVKEKREKILSCFVSSLRLDLIVSAGFGIKRSLAAKLIKDGRVNLSGRMIKSPDCRVRENDSVTAKGFGKFVFSGEAGTSKKGRIAIKIKKLL